MLATRHLVFLSNIFEDFVVRVYEVDQFAVLAECCLYIPILTSSAGFVPKRLLSLRDL